MCTYNGERYIGQQLESIFEQTLAPAEIIVSDDGSTDRTLEIIESMTSACDIQIHVHRNGERLGFSENFLQACDRARGQYIAFSDQDDDWSPRKLEVSFDALTTTGARLSVHGVDKMTSEGARLRGGRQSSTRTTIIHPLRSHPWGNFLGFTMLFERSLLDHLPRESRGLDPHAHGARLSHDRWVYFLAATFGRIVVLPDSLANYRQHDRQLYGGLKERSMGERVATKLAGGHKQAVYLAQVAAHRASLLESMIPSDVYRSGPPTPEFAGATWWRAVQSHIENSAQLYVCSTAAERFSRFFRNTFSGSYRSFRHGGLGARRFLEDAVVVILIGMHARGRGSRFRRS